MQQCSYWGQNFHISSKTPIFWIIFQIWAELKIASVYIKTVSLFTLAMFSSVAAVELQLNRTSSNIFTLQSLNTLGYYLTIYTDITMLPYTATSFLWLKMDATSFSHIIHFYNDAIQEFHTLVHLPLFPQVLSHLLAIRFLFYIVSEIWEIGLNKHVNLTGFMAHKHIYWMSYVVIQTRVLCKMVAHLSCDV